MAESVARCAFLKSLNCSIICYFERGRVATLTGFRDRKGREVLYRLLEMGLLVSDTPRGKVRLSFPTDAAEQWFPRLYPAATGA
ncbi:hypothetical protein [Spiribacter insolitus]|uniref:Uncharacterized protein n=1 Tax=Spiribacter insolitus TaxID=3122417 RepID=A0ABV3T8H4_9GAMM